MALSSKTIQNNRTSLSLPKKLTDEIWANAVEESAVMRLAQRVSLPGAGAAIPVLLGDATADFVGETHEKPVSNASVELVTMTPYKIAVIELFSNEFRRDLPAVYDELVRRLPAAIGKKFDETVFLGTAPGTGFTVLSGVDGIDLDAEGKTVYGQLVEAMAALGEYDLNGWAISPAGRAKLLGATDTTGRPIFTPSTAEGSIGSILGAPVELSRRVYDADKGIVGFAGDWTQARWGMVGDIAISISEEATVNDGTNQVNLWQRNMFAVRVEAEVGFVAKTDAFVSLKETAADGE